MDIPEDETVKQFKERTNRFFSLVGHCITQWAHVDQALFDLCGIALRTPEETTAVVFFRSPNIGDHAVLVDKLLQLKLKKQKKRLSAWDRVKKQLDDLMPFRNQLAHSPPIQHGGGLAIYLEKRKEGDVGPEYVPSRLEKIGEPYWSITVDERKLLLRPKDNRGRPSKKIHDEIKEADLKSHYEEVTKAQDELYALLKVLRPKSRPQKASRSRDASPARRDLRFRG